VTAFCATLNVLPIATEIGWPVNGPNHDRVPVEVDVRHGGPGFRRLR
jgi:hypothetical protein